MPYHSTMTSAKRLAGAIMCAGALAGFFGADARAQGFPFGGAMPDVGAIDYDLALSAAWSPQRLRMTGLATQHLGRILWINCTQPSMAPIRACRLMVDGQIGEEFPLPPNVDLGQWMASRFGPKWPPGGFGGFSGPGSGPDGAMEVRGQWRMGSWMAKGRFRYWR
ncbi:MAG: hypothetical protein KDJ16_11275 [Hyphomicrobiales bacterium]|nr:hypothetical protein [Hyphomicrobiales bacterium]